MLKSEREKAGERERKKKIETTEKHRREKRNEVKYIYILRVCGMCLCCAVCVSYSNGENKKEWGVRSKKTTLYIYFFELGKKNDDLVKSYLYNCESERIPKLYSSPQQKCNVQTRISVYERWKEKLNKYIYIHKIRDNNNNKIDRPMHTIYTCLCVWVWVVYTLSYSSMRHVKISVDWWAKSWATAHYIQPS